MLNSKDIRNVKFSKSVGGYKQEEVDILLDKVEADYEQFERVVKDLQLKADSLEKEIEGYKNSQSSIQNVLVSAQKLADQIVDEAKAKSEQIVKNAEASIEIITAREKELADTFEHKSQQRKDTLQNELDAMLVKAQQKRDAIEKATADSVKRQQILFDKLKLEISAFKAEITRSYKEHLEILQKLPDAVPMDPQNMTEAVRAAIEKSPAPESFFETSVLEDAVKSEENVSTEETTEQGNLANNTETANGSAAPEKSASGFVIAPADDIVAEN